MTGHLHLPVLRFDLSTTPLILPASAHPQVRAHCKSVCCDGMCHMPPSLPPRAQGEPNAASEFGASVHRPRASCGRPTHMCHNVRRPKSRITWPSDKACRAQSCQVAHPQLATDRNVKGRKARRKARPERPRPHVAADSPRRDPPRTHHVPTTGQLAPSSGEACRRSHLRSSHPSPSPLPNRTHSLRPSASFPPPPVRKPPPRRPPPLPPKRPEPTCLPPPPWPPRPPPRVSAAS